MLRIVLLILLSCGAAQAATTILVYGDSLSAGYGLPQGSGWVHLLQQRLEREKYDYRVVNVSVSGETTSGGRNRIHAALTQHNPAIVVVELGANDGLRGANTDTIRQNLIAIIAACRARNALVLLVGMQLPPNYGNDYAEKFRSIYSTIAKTQRVALTPFLFQGFAVDRASFQPDGIHPNAAAQPHMLDNVWIALRPTLRRPAKSITR